MPTLGPSGIAMLQNCQAAADYLNDWERGFIESISLKSGDYVEVSLSEKQAAALVRIWRKLPRSLQNLHWTENHRENTSPGLTVELDNDIPF